MPGGEHELGYLKGQIESLTKTVDDFRAEMRNYMQQDLAAHEAIRKELHSLTVDQAVQKVKLGAIVAAVSIAINQGISRFFSN